MVPLPLACTAVDQVETVQEKATSFPGVGVLGAKWVEQHLTVSRGQIFSVVLSPVAKQL